MAGKATAAIAGDAARYIEALRAETSHFDVQGLKFGDNRAYRFPIDEFYIPSRPRRASARTRPSAARCVPDRFRCRRRCWRIAGCW